VQKILDGISRNHVANRSHSFISAFFDWVVKLGIVQSSPVTKIVKLHKEETRGHISTEEDINLLWATTRKEAYPFEDLFKVKLLTIKRLREVERMRRENVDFNKAVWAHTGSMTKTKNATQYRYQERS
jgi:integrase